MVRNEKKRIATDLILMLFSLILFLSCFSNVDRLRIYQFSNDTNASFYLYHAVALLCLPLFIINNILRMPNKYISSFFLLVIISSLFYAPLYGFSGLAVNYTFNFYIIIMIMSLGYGIEVNQWINAIQKIALLVLLLVNINILINLNAIIKYLANPYAHPVFEVLFGGGVNLEATWIGMFSLFFLKSPKGILYFCNATLISVIYASRVGIIVNVLCVLWIVYSSKEKINRKLLFAFIIASIVFIFFIFRLGLMDGILSRFINHSIERGTIGRLNMWKYIFDAFCKYPFGVGCGNAIKILATVSGLSYSVGNVHNIYLQVLLDEGIVGFVLYCGMIVTFFLSELKRNFTNPFAAFLGVYFIVGLLQFRGADFIMAFVLGIYLCTKNQEILPVDGSVAIKPNRTRWNRNISKYING